MMFIDDENWHNNVKTTKFEIIFKEKVVKRKDEKRKNA